MPNTTFKKGRFTVIEGEHCAARVESSSAGDNPVSASDVLPSPSVDAAPNTPVKRGRFTVFSSAPCMYGSAANGEWKDADSAVVGGTHLRPCQATSRAADVTAVRDQALPSLAYPTPDLPCNGRELSAASCADLTHGSGLCPVRPGTSCLKLARCLSSELRAAARCGTNSPSLQPPSARRVRFDVDLEVAQALVELQQVAARPGSPVVVPVSTSPVHASRVADLPRSVMRCYQRGRFNVEEGVLQVRSPMRESLGTVASAPASLEGYMCRELSDGPIVRSISAPLNLHRSEAVCDAMTTPLALALLMPPCVGRGIDAPWLDLSGPASEGRPGCLSAALPACKGPEPLPQRARTVSYCRRGRFMIETTTMQRDEVM